MKMRLSLMTSSGECCEELKDHCRRRDEMDRRRESGRTIEYTSIQSETSKYIMLVFIDHTTN